MKITLPYPIALSDLAPMAGGKLISLGVPEQVEVTHICTDSREADGNTLFCAIRGERVDGHSYVSKAAELGCTAFLCERVPDHAPAAYVVVEDTVAALSALALSRREGERKNLEIVAITGSVGKTTTKEMTAAVLSRGKSLFKKDGNFNSTIGLPLSFLEINASVECAVLEMGMSGRGEIASMTEAVRPDIAVIANVGSSHLEYLGTRENIARAKLEIARGLRAGGTLIINGDKPLLSRLGQDFGEDLPVIPEGIRVLRVSLAGAPDADYTVKNITVRDGGMSFDLTTPDGLWKDLWIPTIGEHLVWAASFAAAVGQRSGLSEGQVKAGLSAYRPADMRQNTRMVSGVTVIEDCYNAAPESMKAALQVLKLTAASVPDSRRIAVLGDMKELGENTVALHRGVGTACIDHGVDLLITVGELGAEIARGAMEAGMPAEAVRIAGGADAYEDIAAYLSTLLQVGDCVLFKASRSMALERIAGAVMKKLNNE